MNPTPDPPLVAAITKGPSVLRSAATIGGLSILTLALGFGVQVAYAAQLGAGPDMDVFLVALALPALVANVSMAALSLSLVPVIRGSIATGLSASARPLFRRILIQMTPASFILAAGIALAAAPITRLIAPGFDHESFRDASTLLRIMSLGALLDIYRAVMSSFYYAQGRFFIPQIAPVLNHAIMIVAALALYPLMGLEALAIGWVIGSILMLMLLFSGLHNEPDSPSGQGDAEPGAGWASIQIWPALVLVLASQVTPVIDRGVATILPAGSVSFLGYGYKILETMLRTVPMAVVLGAFPRMSAHAASNDWGTLRAEIQSALKWIILGAIPIGLLVLHLREPLIRVLFERGAFGEGAVRAVAAVSTWYAIALLPASVAYLFQHVYFAIRRPNVLALLAAVSILLTAILDYLLSRLWGFEGIAISFLAVSSISVFGLIYFLHLPGHTERVRIEGPWLGRVLMAALVLSASVSTTRGLLSSIWPGLVDEPLVIGLTAGLGAVGYYLALRFSRLPEMALLDARRLLMRRSQSTRTDT